MEGKPGDIFVKYKGCDIEKYEIGDITEYKRDKLQSILNKGENIIKLWVELRDLLLEGSKERHYFERGIENMSFIGSLTLMRMEVCTGDIVTIQTGRITEFLNIIDGEYKNMLHHNKELLCELKKIKGV